MAAGDRKIKIEKVVIDRASPVTYQAFWVLIVENKVGVDERAREGSTSGSFGTPAAFRAMTGLQIENQVNADVAADARTPARDSLS